MCFAIQEDIKVTVLRQCPYTNTFFLHFNRLRYKLYITSYKWSSQSDGILNLKASALKIDCVRT